MTKNFVRIFSVSVLAVVLFSVSAVAGWWFSPLSPTAQPSTPTEDGESVEVYYAKPDGIYRVSSSASEEEKVLDEPMHDPTLSLQAAGANHEYLVYVVSAANEQQGYTYYRPLAVRRLTLATGQQETLVTFSSREDLRGMLVSPDGTKLALAKSVNPAEPGGADEVTSSLALWDIEKLEVIKEWDAPKSFLILVLDRWFSNHEIALGYAYEGASFCLHDITADSFPAVDGCSGYGSTGMGGREVIFAKENEKQYGFEVGNEEITGQKVIEGLFTRQGTKGDKNFVVNGLLQAALKHDTKLYYLHTTQKPTYPLGGLELYEASLDGKSVRKLTSTSGTTGVKERLEMTPSGRYLYYQQYFPSDIGQERDASSFTATSVWLYDTKLEKVFRVATGRQPVVIHRSR